MPFVRLGGWRQDRVGEAAVLAEPFRQAFFPQKHTLTPVPVGAPGMARPGSLAQQIRAVMAHTAWAIVTLGSGYRTHMVGDDVLRRFKEMGGKLVKHLAFEGNRLVQHVVEGRDAIRRHENQLVAGSIGVSHFTPVSGAQAGIIGFSNRV